MERIILAGVADDNSISDVVATARRLGEMSGLPVRYLHVVAMAIPPEPTLRGYGGSVRVAMARTAYQELRTDAIERGREFVAGLDLDPDETHVQAGDAGAALLRRARRLHAAMIVVGTRGRGPVRAAVAGSVSRRLVRDANRPVIVARPSAAVRRPAGPVVCGVEAADKADGYTVRAAARLARLLRRRLAVAHVPSAASVSLRSGVAYVAFADVAAGHGQPPRLLVHYAREHARAGGIADDVDVRLTPPGRAAERLADLADGLDAPVIAVGAKRFGLGLVAAGSVSSELCRSAMRPVAVVPPAARADEPPDESD